MEGSIQELKEAFLQSDLKELYHYPSGDKTIVMEESSGRIYLRKRMSLYNKAVFSYLMDHPNPHIPKICSASERDGSLIVMEEYVMGETLASILKKGGVPLREGLSYMEQLCQAVAHLHRATPPIIHRDIKPANIVITDDKTLYLIDYDAAKLYLPEQERDTVLMGTPGSAAPEQYGFGQSDVRTDVYAVGVLLKEMFPDNPRLQRVAERATMLNPVDRYQSIAALERAIMGWHAFAGSFIPGAQAKPKLRPLFPPPGFRTGSVGHMLLALVGYGLTLAVGVSIVTSEKLSPLDLWIERICLIMAVLTGVDIFTNWTGLGEYLPLVRHSNRTVAVTARCLWCAAFFVAWIWLAVVIEGITP